MTHLPHERVSPSSGTPPPATALLTLPEAQQLMDRKEDLPGSLEAWAPALDLLLFSCLNVERSLHHGFSFPISEIAGCLRLLAF